MLYYFNRHFQSGFQRIKLFATNSDFLIPISLQPNVKELKYNINYDSSKDLSLKYQRFTILCCKDIRIRQFEFVAKTKFLFGELF